MYTIIVNTPGPQGSQGPQGPSGSQGQSADTGSLVTTSSFNSFTSSYYVDSASFNSRIDNITFDTSSLATTGSNTFIGDQIINGENLGFIVDAGNLKRVGFMKYGGIEGSIARVANQNFRILRTTGSDINDGTNAITDFYIAGDGKIGIGTTSPAYTLDVSGSSNFTGDTLLTGSLYQSGTFYPDQIDWFNSSIGYNTGSYILTTTNNGLTTYASYQDIANTLVPYINTGSFTGSFIGSLQGTSSWAEYATTSSHALSIPNNLNLSASNLFVTNDINAASITAQSASFGYVESITGSAVYIGQEFIILNTQPPAARYAGLVIIDSGSANHTSSLLWDSSTNHFIYQNASGSSYTGGGFISGPRNTGSLEDTTYPTLNKIVRGQGGDHIYDSNITDNDTKVSISISTDITGSLIVTNGITASLQGTASWASQALTASYGNITGSLFGTASWAINALTASYIDGGFY